MSGGGEEETGCRKDKKLRLKYKQNTVHTQTIYCLNNLTNNLKNDTFLTKAEEKC